VDDVRFSIVHREVLGHSELVVLGRKAGQKTRSLMLLATSYAPPVVLGIAWIKLKVAWIRGHTGNTDLHAG
jgi:hypothetical protein